MGRRKVQGEKIFYAEMKKNLKNVKNALYFIGKQNIQMKEMADRLPAFAVPSNTEMEQMV